MVPYLRAANVSDGTLNLSDVKRMNFTPREQEVYRLKPGDVLVTEGSGSLSAVGASAVWNGELDGVVCFQNTLLRMRPRSTTDPRFLAWWSRHAFDDGLYASLSTGANIYHLSAERVRSVPVSFPDVPEQQSIANFLDVETARIDALLATKSSMLALLKERLRSSLEYKLFRDRTSGFYVSLGRLADILPGYAYSSSDFVAHQANATRLLRGINVDVGSCRWGEVAYLPNDHDEHARTSRTYALDEGDIVIGMDRPFIAGGTRIAVIEQQDLPALLVQRVARLRPKSDASASWIRYLLSGPRFEQYCNPISTGVSVPHISAEQIASFRVPNIPVSMQLEIASRFCDDEALVNETIKKLSTQMGLIEERKRALITAAVSAQMGVPEVAA